MKIKKLEDMKVWKEAVDMSVEIYNILKTNKFFLKDFGLKDQIQRSAVSIPSNIAEGFERESDAEFARFLYIAKASCAELKTQLLISKRIDYIDETDYKKLKEKCDYISVMIYKLIVYLKKK